MDIGGWVTVCRSKVDELQWLQKRFIESYVSAVRMNREHPSKLLGEFEVENRIRGYEVAPPVLIGDPMKAKQVAQTQVEGVQVARLTH